MIHHFMSILLFKGRVGEVHTMMNKEFMGMTVKEQRSVEEERYQLNLIIQKNAGYICGILNP